jgi:hypothetical protein
MKYLAICLLLFVVTACATSNLTDAEKEALKPVHDVYKLRGEFNIVLRQINAYARQPACTEVVVVACSDKDVVVEALRLSEGVDDALDAAEVAVRRGLDTGANATVARSLLRQLSSYLVARQI